MSTEDGKAVVRRLFEDCVAAKNIGLVEEIFADDFVWHGLPARGLKGIRDHIAVVFEALPDVTPVVEDQIAEGDMVATRYAVTSTFAQSWYGIEATGKTASWAGMVICRLSSGKIAEWWMVEDVLSMWQQFGALSQLVTQDDASGN
jgi:predicted ester cyclase